MLTKALVKQDNVVEQHTRLWLLRQPGSVTNNLPPECIHHLDTHVYDPFSQHIIMFGDSEPVTCKEACELSSKRER